MAGEEDLLSGILGAADPGDTGKDDLGGGQDDQEDDTGSVEDEDDQELDASDHDQEDDDNDEEDAGDDAGSDDPLARQPVKRGRPKKEDVDPTKGKPDPFSPTTKIRTDKAGNVYVGNDLVAKGGREARMFMGFRNAAIKDRKDADVMAQHAAKLAEGAKELYARYETLREQKNLFDGAGLTSEEQAQLLPLALAYKKNPVEGLKLLLTRAHMAGVDIKSLGAGGGLDPKVLMEDMKAYMGELVKPLTAQTTQSAHQEALRKEATGFFQRNPRAKDVARIVGGSHRLGQILNEARRKAPDLSLDELFGKLDYALLRQFGGQLPTGPVDKKPKPRSGKNTDRRMERNFRSSVGKDKLNPSFDEIAASVLRDAQAASDAADSRGF